MRVKKVGRQGQTRYEDTQNQSRLDLREEDFKLMCRRKKKRKKKSMLVLGINNADTMLG